jgi:hypothetical protein
MYRPCGPHDFVYVHTDIPEGMTIREWRAQRAAAHQAERAARRSGARIRRLCGAAKIWLTERYPQPRIRSFRRAAG